MPAGQDKSGHTAGRNPFALHRRLPSYSIYPEFGLTESALLFVAVGNDAGF